MKKRTLSGIIIGGAFGALVAWGAMSSALSEGGLVALAGAFEGLMGGLGIGWLIGINIAEGAVEEPEEGIAQTNETGELATAH
jgi:hypothetical protein